jgi:peroxiredoxin
MTSMPAPPLTPHRKRAAAVLGLGLLAAGLSAAIALRQTPHVHTDLLGRGAPDFALPLIRTDGGPTQARIGPKDLRGKPLLVHFWAPSCKPCAEELPRWQSLWADTARRGDLQILTVAGDESLDVIDYLRKHSYTFPVAYDGAGAAHRAWGVDGIPFSAAVAANGEVITSVEGPLSDKGLQDLADRARSARREP